MFCEKCGSQVRENSTFCENCGASMNRSAPNPAAQPRYAAPNYAPPPPNYIPSAPNSHQSYGSAAPNGRTGYAAPGYQGEMSVGQWMITLLIMCIPIAGLVMMFVWAFGSGAPVAKRNFCRASFIYAAIGIGLYIILMIAGVSMMSVMFDAMY